MSAAPSSPTATADELRAAFDRSGPPTIGIEDEALLLDPETLDLVPRAQEVLDALGGDTRFKLELPASQIESTTPVCDTVAEVASALLDARNTLARAAGGIALPAGAGVHPFAAATGELNRSPRYDHTVERYAGAASRQLVCALQVHVAPGGAERALAIHNRARDYLPWIAALAANAPFYEGADTGLASVRPKLCQLLPRQGVPPALESWEAYADALRWGAASGAFTDPRTWWWELRPHPDYGTLEFRVPDGQATVADAAAIAALIQCLSEWLGEQHDAGVRWTPHPAWQIEENRFSACRHGVEGRMVDLDTGAARETRECLHTLLDELAPVAQKLECAAELRSARALIERNGAIAQREVAREGGVRAVAAWLTERFAAER